jgi:hypothetical protein
MVTVMVTYRLLEYLVAIFLVLLTESSLGIYIHQKLLGP